jgi:hypothetical protein
MKILGLTVDHKMTYKSHIETVARRAAGAVAMILRLKLEGYPRSSLRMIYQSLLVSHIRYCISIWGSASRALIKPVQTQMNKGIRIMFGLHPWTSTRETMATAKIPNVDQLYKMASAKFIFSNTLSRGAHDLINRSLNRPLPHSANSQIATRAQTTRNLYVPAYNLEIRRRTIFIKGVRDFNALPAIVRKPSTFTSFKARLKKYVLQ